MNSREMELNIILSRLLKKKGWSLTKLARESGVPVSTLHTWVSAPKTTLNLEQLKRVSLILETSLHSLAFGCNDPFEATEDNESLKQIFSGDVRVTVHQILKGKKNA